MQIILTEEEYQALKDQGNIAIQVGECVAYYQRKFRSHLSQSLQSAGALKCGGTIQLDYLRSCINEAEEFAKKVS